jgi:hypothetical protein
MVEVKNKGAFYDLDILLNRESQFADDYEPNPDVLTIIKHYQTFNFIS